MNVVPLPAAVWLFASGLGFLGWTGLPWLEGPKKK